MRYVATWQASASVPGGRTYTVTDSVYGGALLARHYSIRGMGHAWPGGDARYPFAGLLSAAFDRAALAIDAGASAADYRGAIVALIEGLLTVKARARR